MEGVGLQYQRINPMLDVYIPVPEEAKMEHLIEAVLSTLRQCNQEQSEVQAFSRKFNNLRERDVAMQ